MQFYWILMRAATDYAWLTPNHALRVFRMSVKDQSYLLRYMYPTKHVSASIPSAAQLPTEYVNATEVLFAPCEAGPGPVKSIAAALAADFGNTVRCFTTFDEIEAYHTTNYSRVYGAVVFTNPSDLLTPGEPHCTVCVDSSPFDRVAMAV